MNHHDLLHRGADTPHFVMDVGPTLVLTVNPDALIVCDQCDKLHIRIGLATPELLRQLAISMAEWAERLEALP